jgi:small subunit ribosomal protein S19
MARSKWKAFYTNNQNKKILQQLKNHSTNTKVSRNTIILPNFITKTFKVYNGKNFNKISVTIEMVGHKFGAFCFT